MHSLSTHKLKQTAKLRIKDETEISKYAHVKLSCMNIEIKVRSRTVSITRCLVGPAILGDVEYNVTSETQLKMNKNKTRRGVEWKAVVAFRYNDSSGAASTEKDAESLIVCIQQSISSYLHVNLLILFASFHLYQNQ